MWGSELSFLWENFGGYNCATLWVAHPMCMGLDFVMITSILPSRSGSFFVSGCRTPFGRFQYYLLLVGVQHLVMISVFPSESVSSCTLPQAPEGQTERSSRSKSLFLLTRMCLGLFLNLV